MVVVYWADELFRLVWLDTKPSRICFSTVILLNVTLFVLNAIQIFIEMHKKSRRLMAEYIKLYRPTETIH